MKGRGRPRSTFFTVHELRVLLSRRIRGGVHRMNKQQLYTVYEHLYETNPDFMQYVEQLLEQKALRE